MLGPYGEMGVTVACSYKGGDGVTKYGGYYPYMYLTQDAAIDAGRVLGFPKKEAFIRVLEHGGNPDDGYGVYDGKNYQFDYYSFLMIRNGYVIHSCTGKYDDADLPAKPAFYGNTEYGRMNMKVVTTPDVASSEWQLVYLPSLVTKDLATAMGRPDTEGSHRFQVKPESIRTSSPASMNWFMQATPYDNLGHELPPTEMIGLMTFSFDLIIPAGGEAVPLWSSSPVPEANRPRGVGHVTILTGHFFGGRSHIRRPPLEEALLSVQGGLNKWRK